LSVGGAGQMTVDFFGFTFVLSLKLSLYVFGRLIEFVFACVFGKSDSLIRRRKKKRVKKNPQSIDDSQSFHLLT
jgi:hypothetical protein